MKLLKQAAVLAAVTCALLACESGTGDDDIEVQPLTQEQLLNPESCKDCHPKHYEQWSASMHAYAAVDPVFLAMNKRGQEETGGQLGAFCVNCHAPMAVRTGALTDFANVESMPAHLKGVTCYFCHNAVGVGDKHVNGNVNLAMDDVMRAAVRNPVEPTAHKVAASTFHDATTEDSSRLCGTCHDIETPKGVRLERTYEEYLGSLFADASNPTFFKSCNDCHMSRLRGGRQQIATKTGRSSGQVLARDFHEHLWPAVDVALTDWPHADAMRSAVSSCVLPNTMSAYITIERSESITGDFTVWMEQDAGHMFPSGAAQDRRLWLELIAYDENLKELYRVGQIGDQEIEEPAGSVHPCMLREYMLDDAGNETHDFWEAASLDPKSRQMLVAPKGIDPTKINHATECAGIRPPLAFANITPAFIDMRLRVRPMGIDVLQDLVSTGHLTPDIPAKMPTFTVFSRRATYNAAARSYSVAPQNDDPTLGDCASYLCMLDPQGPECAKK
jgi:nitrate/TMAO reductase-like tetraheme cytochrome c subunit